MVKRYARGGLWGYAAGAAAARTGDEMSGPALLLTGLAVTGSAVVGSALLAGIMIAAAVGGPLFGVLLDRSARPGALLAGALAGYAVALIAILLGLGRIPIGVTVLIAVFAGLLGPALAGGWTSQLPRVVPPAALPRANALDAMTFNAAGLLGPALAGAVAHLAGAGAGVVVAAVLVALALPVALTLPGAAGRVPVPSTTSTSTSAVPTNSSASSTSSDSSGFTASSISADLAAGFRAVARVRPLARATAVSVISCAGQGMLIACAPLLGERVLGGAGQGTVLLSGVALSALVANALLARAPAPGAGPLSPDAILGWSTVLLASALALAATARPVPLAIAVVLIGIGEGPQLTALFAIRHREAPERLRGQVFTTGASLKLSGFAIGAALAGPLAVRSLPGALLTAAFVQLLAALCHVLWPPTLSAVTGRMWQAAALRTARRQGRHPMHEPETPRPATATGRESGDYPALDRIVDERYVTVRAGDQDLVVTFDSIDPDRRLDPETIRGLLPHVRSLLADFAAVRERATEYLWSWGAQGDETDAEKTEFLRDVIPSTLVVSGPTTSELHYENVDEKYMMDGYWPAVHFDRDMTAVKVTVEA
ncbi:MFS transporter [Streptomyces sp. NPDC004726]